MARRIAEMPKQRAAQAGHADAGQRGGYAHSGCEAALWDGIALDRVGNALAGITIWRQPAPLKDSTMVWLWMRLALLLTPLSTVAGAPRA